MSATEAEVVSPMAAEAEAAAETKLEKPAEEKKAKAPKEKKPPRERKPREAPSHPPYFEMIKEAILALQEKNGSSSYAIAKYMEEKHKAVLPANYKKMLGVQLKNCTAKGRLIKIKASFKLAESVKEEKATKGKEVKKPKQAAPTAPARKTRSVKKIVNKVGGRRGKKSGSVKPKQPKSIRSPSTRKAKKATA